MPDTKLVRVPVLVLAGGKTGAAFAQAAGVPDTPGSRALAEIDRLPMVQYVLRALRQAVTIDRIVLVAPSGFPDQPGAHERIAADGGLEENIRAGLARTGGAEFALIVTADIPFVTAEGIDDYVRRCAALDVDCCYTAVPKTACDKQFPGTKRTYLLTGGEAHTGGNVVFQRVAAYEREAALLREAHARRKSPLFLARLIGAGNAFKLLTGRLRLEDIEAAASRIMGVRCRIVVTPFAELGTDVDKPEDLAMARERLRS